VLAVLADPQANADPDGRMASPNAGHSPSPGGSSTRPSMALSQIR
jgi:hypothetical protein